MNLQKLIPSLHSGELMELLMQGRWHVDHGSLERFPDFMRSDGALSGIHKLGNWRHFDIGFKDRAGKYNQLNGSGNSAATYYEMGALVRSTAIDEACPEAKRWLETWAQALGVFPRDLRLNSWAVRGANGIHWHFDPEDVVHFQIKGDKLLKFLPSEVTRFADTTAKRAERFMARVHDFSRAAEQVVREGTITIIPRGVWHWSESQSPESFAISLCINPSSYAWTVAQSLYKRLRLLEERRRPLAGDPRRQLPEMQDCLRDAGLELQKMNGTSVLVEERRLGLELDQIDFGYFYASQAARIDRDPLRLWVNEHQLAASGGAPQMAILKTICENAHGFHARQILQRLPDSDRNLARDILSSLFKIGFLEIILTEAPTAFGKVLSGLTNE